MFGGFGPKLKGGMTRFQQRLSTGLTYILTGPPDANLTIEPGTSRTLTIQGAGLVFTGLSGTSPGGITMTTGSSTAATGNGAAYVFTAGNGGGANGDGGGFTFTGGNSGASSGNGGGITLVGGIATSSPQVGGAITLEGGQSVGAGTGGYIRLRPGAGASRNANIQLDGGRGAALATGATGGFVTVPTCAGAPTGVPNASDVPTGSVATVVDTTNLRAYFYIAGTWRYAQLV